jgi:hypothetical protein
MDAREAQLWLQTKLKEKGLIEAEQQLKGKLERAPISELERRKLLVLRECSFGSNRGARNFVNDILGQGRNVQITTNQSEYIEILWYRYRAQHGYRLPEPYTEIMRFNQDLPIEPYGCNYGNERFTITFQYPDEISFF